MSGELAEQGIIAVVSAILGMLIYVWFRFEWQFAVGAVLSLLHDVLLTIGLFCLLRIEFNLQIIAAILTIVGYSLNDTVVVFDRIREYLRKYKSMPLADLIDFSINSVLPRTILTSVTTMLALIALYIFGGEVIARLHLHHDLGRAVGTYSSIFIASPVLILLGTVRASRRSADARRARRPPGRDGASTPAAPPSTPMAAGGFRFAGMSHRGSILVLPSAASMPGTSIRRH